MEAITRLVDSRLLTSEEHGGVRRIELTHDVLTAVARRSRDARRQREAAAQRRRRRNRLIGFTCGLALLVAGTSVPLAIWALQERKDAIEQAKIAVAAKNDAVQRSRDAVAARDELEAKNRELGSLLKEASRSDQLVAEEKLVGGEAPVALAHLAREIRYEPVSTLAPEAAVAALDDWRFPLPIATLEGHEGPVHSAQFSPDGKRIVTASDDKTARLWDTESGKLLATLQGHESYVNSAQFSPDGKRIVTASYDKGARLWEAESGRLLATFQGHEGRVTSAQFSPDGKRVVTASADKTARLWETESGKLLVTLQGHEGLVTHFLFCLPCN
jgi:hypothetical protein